AHIALEVIPRSDVCPARSARQPDRAGPCGGAHSACALSGTRRRQSAPFARRSSIFGHPPPVIGGSVHVHSFSNSATWQHRRGQVPYIGRTLRGSDDFVSSCTPIGG